MSGHNCNCMASSPNECSNQRHSHDHTATLKRRCPGAFLVQYTDLCNGSIKMNDDQILWCKKPPTLLIYLQVKLIYKTTFSLLFEFKRLRFPILHYQPLNLVLLGDSTLRRELLLSAFLLNMNQIKFDSINMGVWRRQILFYKTCSMLLLLADH